MKLRLFLLAFTLLVTGCANLEYAKNLKPEELLYQTDTLISEKSKTLSQSELVSLYLNLGSDKAGYVGSHASEQRSKWDIQYPIVPHDNNALDKISGFTFSLDYRTRIGQALIFSADLDPLTSGFLKDLKGRPISVSGRFALDANVAMTQGLTTGVVVGATTGVGINSAASAQMAQGLIIGVVAGLVHTRQAETAIQGILASKNFGERITATTVPAAYLLPRMDLLGPDGLSKSAKPVVIAPGVTKNYFIAFGEKTIDYRTDLYLITVVSTYRGKALKESYPNTDGWDSIISNMAVIRLNADERDDLEKRFKAIKKEAVTRNLF